MTREPRQPGIARQRGATLVVALIFLAILCLFAVAAYDAFEARNFLLETVRLAQRLFDQRLRRRERALARRERHLTEQVDDGNAVVYRKTSTG